MEMNLVKGTLSKEDKKGRRDLCYSRAVMVEYTTARRELLLCTVVERLVEGNGNGKGKGPLQVFGMGINVVIPALSELVIR